MVYGTLAAGGFMSEAPSGSNPLTSFTDCSFQENSSSFAGGAMATIFSSFSLLRCSFLENEGGFTGGAISLATGSLDVSECSFIGNTSNYGGAISIDVVECMLERSIFVDNAATEAGGAIDTTQAVNTIDMTHCTLVGGSFTFQGGSAIRVMSNSTVNMVNSIVWDNQADPFQIFGQLIINYSDIQEGYAGVGNIVGDPLFISVADNDLRLNPGSPCIDTGDHSGPSDPDGSVADMGALPYEAAFRYEKPPRQRLRSQQIRDD